MLEVPIKIDLPQEAEENEPQPKDYSSFDNYSKKRVTLVGYLIGLKETLYVRLLVNDSVKAFFAIEAIKNELLFSFPWHIPYIEKEGISNILSK